MSTSSLAQRLIRTVRRVQTDCQADHWHVIESGWYCCQGAHEVRAKRGLQPPRNTTAVCAGLPTAEEESFTAWLAGGAPELLAQMPKRSERKHLARLV